jgi:hypothetical protein
LDAYSEAQDIETIHALKLDVEGHEPFVLAGSQRLLLEGRIRCIVCEFNEFHLKRNGSGQSRRLACGRAFLGRSSNLGIPSITYSSPTVVVDGIPNRADIVPPDGGMIHQPAGPSVPSQGSVSRRRPRMQP